MDFEQEFERISGFAPYRWQIDLFEAWRNGVFQTIAIPTGLGKTSAMLVWLLALASQASENPKAIKLPRRFVMVVDRRTVVDQATEVAGGLLRWLDENPDHQITTALASLVSETHLRNEHVLSISTLRGERADNGGWKRDPARPAIIIGTVYKIGSRLLFWSDGDSRTRRSMHAGLLGHDVLLVHDEAHLSPAFADLLRAIHRFQQRRPDLKPFHCVEMTATPSNDNGDVLRLPQADRDNPRVTKRLFANKALSLHELDNDTTPATKRAAMTERAMAFSDACKLVIIYVTSPEDAASIVADLRKQAQPCDVRLLTGTLRGYERDKLALDPVFQRFLHRQEIPHTTYLVSTSAGAVGIDLDADTGIFDLCTLDNFIQRAGRINRSGGGGRTASIDLIYTRTDFAKDRKGQAPEIVRPNLSKTLELLCELPASSDGLDASPEALTALVSHPAYLEACEPKPRMRELEEYLLDTWSMTSVKPRIGPEVEPWLRGISTDDPPYTTLIWREWPHRCGDGQDDQKKIDAWLNAYPIRVAEKSSIRTDRARKFFEALAKRAGEAANSTQILVVGTRESITTLTLADLSAQSSRIANATIILPVPLLGGLSPEGIPDASCKEKVMDVADQPDADLPGRRERWLLSGDDEDWVAKRAGEELPIEADTFDAAVRALEKHLRLRTTWIDTPATESGDREDTTSACVYLVARRPAFPDDTESGAQTVTTQKLDKHLHLVGASARAIGEALGLDPTLIEQLANAGAAHDRGKDRSWWQQAAGNFSSEVLAKCYGRRANWRRLHGYRHEFGSLLDLGDQGMSDELVLHLVASHHGRARPGFDTSAYDNQHALARNEQAAMAAELRFESLQSQYGWWGLAYLEALLKCADVMGSKETAE